MDFERYYEEYWQKRLPEEKCIGEPIRSIIPAPLVKYSHYGSVMNQVPYSSKVLDLGCGDGCISSLFLKKSCEVWGVDISTRAVKLAQKRGVRTKLWDLNTPPLPYEEESFDVVTMVDVLEHMTNPLSLLKEAHRLLKSEGRLILSLPNFSRLGNRLRMLFTGDPRDILHWGGYGDGVEHFHWFTLPKIKYFLREADFAEISAKPAGLPFGFILGLLRLNSFARLLMIVASKQ